MEWAAAMPAVPVELVSIPSPNQKMTHSVASEHEGLCHARAVA
jgi:hypothetical protein